jgi:hypothetical protein
MLLGLFLQIDSLRPGISWVPAARLGMHTHKNRLPVSPSLVGDLSLSRGVLVQRENEGKCLAEGKEDSALRAGIFKA